MSQCKNTTTFTPPMIQGVSASKAFLPIIQHPPKTIIEYLCQEFSHISATEWRQRFHDHLVFDMTGEILTIDSPYQANCHIYYYRFLAEEIHVPFTEKILFENEDLLVVDKPHFLTISPTGQYVQETLLVRLKKTTQNANLTPIHRLDRETAGIVLFSKRPESRGLYQQMFANREVQKVYHAIAPYRDTMQLPLTLSLRMEKGNPFYTMQVVTGEINSITEIDLLEHDGTWAKYQLKPQTGKQHQLRVHLNELNIPIKNDSFYPNIAHKSDDDFSSPLQLLAKEIHFKDPISKQVFSFYSEFDLTL